MTAQESMTGTVLNGRYEIGERIGVGGMAEVYSAQDNVLGRIVAVKVMLSQFANDEDFSRRFRQEAGPVHCPRGWSERGKHRAFRRTLRAVSEGNVVASKG